MMANADLDDSMCKLLRSASGLPMPIADCCRWTPNQPHSETLVTGLIACFVHVGANFLYSGGHESLIGTIAMVELGIKSP
jgi:hypothetical protein